MVHLPRKIVSGLLFLNGLALLYFSEPSITGAVVGTSLLPTEVSFVLGIFLIFAAGIGFLNLPEDTPKSL